MRGRLGGDEGYATVTSAGIIAAVVSLLLVVAGLGARVVDTHRARGAADLAAVAAATALYQGFDPCRAAERTARDNGARMESCTEHPPDVVVTARVGSRSASARAGPL
ncbi:Rv3654c family TadE-like protein [Corynebacterium sp. UBA2622]|uniref:Rv3654c family TadE-like protein n=1 Tax=Corynebacterium sp. UBA2622 TaxID=1946393 RepID=UPI0025C0FCDC|nr:Rv3654c family TadE-like protein [Corynebacterium sp. UBA2622]